jgi:multiple sugar transport system substrate-binding protein
MDLNAPIPARIIDLSNFTQAAKDTQVVQGRNIMVTIGLSTTGAIINTRLFEELGIPVSRAENFTYKSWEALAMEIAAKARGKYYAMGDSTFNNLQSITPVTMWMRSRGKDFFTEDGKLGFGKQDLIEWFELWARLRAAGAVPPPQLSAEEIPKTFEQRLFAAAKMVITNNTTNNLKIHQDIMPNHHLLMVRYPTADGKGGEIFESANIGINAKTKIPDASAQFINYFVNNKRSLELYLIENGFPGSTVMNEYVGSILDPSNKQAMDFTNALTRSNTFAPRIIPPPDALDYQRLLENEGTAAAFGQKTIQRAVDDFFTAAGGL